MDRPSFIKEENIETTDVLAKLSTLAYMQLEYERQVAEKEEELKMLKDKLNKISMEEIPMLLRTNGLSRVKLATGETVEIKEDINVTIKDKDALFDFLKQRGDSELIKTNLAIGKTDGDRMSALYAFLMSQEFDYTTEMSVHSQTLKAYFKELCGLKVDESKRVEGYAKGKYIDPNRLPEFAKIFTLTKTKITNK